MNKWRKIGRWLVRAEKRRAGCRGTPSTGDDNRRPAGQSRGLRAHAGLARRLRAEARREARPAPPFLRERVMAAVRSGGTGSRARGDSAVEFLPRARRGLAIGTAFALFAGSVWIAALNHAGRPPAVPASVPELVSTTRAIEAELPDRARMEKWLSEVNAPLENEMGLAVIDAKTALSSLVASLRAPAEP